MRVTLLEERSIRLEMTGEGFEVASEGVSISPYHLLAASLASCTALVLKPWAENHSIDLGSLRVLVSWETREGRPKRVTLMSMELSWPDLPREKIGTAERVADLCPIHATLTHGTTVTRRITVGTETT